MDRMPTRRALLYRADPADTGPALHADQHTASSARASPLLLRRRSGPACLDVNGDMTRHDTEMSYEFAMGIYFSQDPARRAVYQKRFEKLFSVAIDKDFQPDCAGLPASRMKAIAIDIFPRCGTVRYNPAGL